MSEYFSLHTALRVRLGLLEIDTRRSRREFVAHLARTDELYADARDVVHGELVTGGRAVAAKRDVKRAEVAEAHAVAVEQGGGDVLVEGGEHGLDIVDGDGALVANLFGKRIDLDGHAGRDLCAIEDGLGAGLLEGDDVVLNHSVSVFVWVNG